MSDTYLLDCTLRDGGFQYKCTDFYAPECERTILWNDPNLAIDWEIKHKNTLLLSAKDKAGDSFEQAKSELKGVSLQ